MCAFSWSGFESRSYSRRHHVDKVQYPDVEYRGEQFVHDTREKARLEIANTFSMKERKYVNAQMTPFLSGEAAIGSCNFGVGPNNGFQNP